MKNGKKPTRKQKQMMLENKLDLQKWLVYKNTSGELLLVNRKGNRTKSIKKVEA